MRAIIYLRVSTDMQEREGTSLETQARECVEYAESAGWTVVRIIRDVASGASLDRPGIEEVRRTLCDGACDVLLAHAVDRLSRNQNHVGVLLDEAEEAGVRLDFVTEEFEQTLVGQFILAARAFVAATEREKIVERTVRGKKERARNGRLPQATGKGCYGYTYVPETGRRDLNPVQAPIVVRIFDEFVRGKGVSRITAELNADGIPTFTGKRWYPITVHRILRNETYTGRTVFGKTGTRMVRRPGRKRRVREVYARPENERIEIAGASPPIVSSELFERARARLDDPERHAQHKPTRTYPLRGRLRCHCGTAMSGHAVNRGRYSYYRCNRLYLSAQDERCGSRMVRTEVLESAVRQTLSELVTDPAMVLEMAEALRFDSGNGAPLAEIERSFRKLAEDESRLADLYIDGKLNKPLLEEKGAALATRRAALEREQARLLAEAGPGCHPEVLRERMPKALAFFSEWVQRADEDALVLLAQAFEARIEVAPDEAEIRVEVPLVEPGFGANFATIEQTWAWTFNSHKLESACVPFRRTITRNDAARNRER